MSLSSILDSLSKVANKRTGGPNSLTGQAAYDTNTYRYPLDVGNYDKGHYIVFNVNVQDKTQFNAAEYGVPQAIQNMNDLVRVRGSQNIGGAADILKQEFGSSIASIISKSGGAINGVAQKYGGDAAVEVVQKAGDAAGGVAEQLASLGSGFVRTIYRTTDTIALYMPDQLQFNYSQNYGTPSTSAGALAGLTAAGTSLYELANKGGSSDMKDLAQNMSPFLFNYISGKLGGLGKPLFSAISGVVQNPMIEVLYTSPSLRTFSFTFMFYPRDEKEALEAQMIIDRFRFHQAPEIKNNSGGYFLVPPSEFDIKFMYYGQENPNIDKISTCVLQNISVDYTKAGQWVAYESDGVDAPSLGGTGTPVGIGMTLTFMETQIVTKESLRMSEMMRDTMGDGDIERTAEISRQQAEDRYNQPGPTEEDVKNSTSYSDTPYAPGDDRNTPPNDLNFNEWGYGQ